MGYNTDLFDGATIARLMRQFEVLLEQVGHNPEQRLSELELMRAEEREQIVGRLERHGGRVSGRAVHSRAVCGAGGAHS